MRLLDWCFRYDRIVQTVICILVAAVMTAMLFHQREIWREKGFAEGRAESEKDHAIMMHQISMLAGKSGAELQRLTDEHVKSYYRAKIKGGLIVVKNGRITVTVDVGEKYGDAE